MSEVRTKILSGEVNVCEGGVDTNTAPQLLQHNQLAGGVNLTVRAVSPRQRPGWPKRLLSFADEDARTAFETGRFQKAKCYEADNGVNSILVSVSGRIYRIIPEQGFVVQDITPASGRNPDNILNGYWEQAENFAIYQNGHSIPIIFDGASCRRATANEIKTGTVMKYANGRIWYSLPDGFSFRATDLVRGPSGTAANRYRDSVLKETENDFLNEGGDFSVPGNSGGVRAMAVPANLDASMGQGPLQIFTPNTVFSVNAPIDRTTWKDVTYPIQTVSQISYGAIGDTNVVPVNGDIFYRSHDGIRSFKVARQDFAEWRMTPVSGEAVKYLRHDLDRLLEFGSMEVFDNRLLATVAPHYSDQGVYHRGLAVLDFNLVSNMRLKLSPAWEGMWTGLNILQILKGRFSGSERCFMFTRNHYTNAIELWEVSKDDQFDDGDTRIEWQIESREFDLGRPYERKRVATADLFVDELIDSVDFELTYKPDSWPGWLPWQSWTECATFKQCLDNLGTCPTIQNLQPQYRPRIRVTEPPDYCYNKRLLRDCETMQGRLKITGPAKLQQIRFNFRDIDESPNADCPVGAACEQLNVCGTDLLSYHADSPA